MKLTLVEPKYFKESISIISELVNEASFKISPEGMELVAMDPANVAMIIFKLLSSAFAEYEVSGTTELAINLNNLKMVLRRAKSNDVLTLELEENKLKITLKGNSVRTFSIPIIEPEEREQRIPELSFDTTIMLKSNSLNEAVEDVDVVAESVTFLTSSDLFTVQAEGDLSRAKIDIKNDDNTKIEVKGDSKIKAKYSIEYLKRMMAASKIAEEVKINFGNDYPLRLDYKVVDKLMLSFILAPRVEND